MLSAKALPFLQQVCSSRKWSDEEVRQDAEFLRDQLVNLKKGLTCAIDRPSAGQKLMMHGWFTERSRSMSKKSRVVYSPGRRQRMRTMTFGGRMRKRWTRRTAKLSSGLSHSYQSSQILMQCAYKQGTSASPQEEQRRYYTGDSLQRCRTIRQE